MLKPIKNTAWAVLFLSIYASFLYIARLILGSERIMLFESDYSKPGTWALGFSISQLAESLFVYVVPAVISLVIYIIFYKFVFKQNIVKSFGFAKTSIKSIILGVFIGVLTALLIILVFHNDALTELVYKKHICSFYDILKQNDLFRITVNTILFDTLGILPMLTVIPIFEEILVRGLVFNKLKQDMPIIFAVVLQALLSGIAQLSLLNGVKAFVVGLLLGTLYIIAKSIWIPVIVHLIVNASVSLFMEIYNVSTNEIMKRIMNFSSDTSSTYTNISIPTTLLSIIIGIILASILALLIYYTQRWNKTYRNQAY